MVELERFAFAATHQQTVGQKLYTLQQEALGQLLQLVHGLFAQGHPCEQVLECKAGAERQATAVYGVDERGQRVISKTFNRTRLREFMANLPACTVAMEACGSAHACLGPTIPR